MSGLLKFLKSFLKMPKTESKTATKSRESGSSPPLDHTVAIPKSNIEEIDSEDAVRAEALLRDLEKNIPAWRDKVMEPLVQIGTPAVPGLIQRLLPEKELDVRQRTALILGRIGPDAGDAIPALIEASVDRDRSMRKAAAEALNKIDCTWPTGSHAQPAVPQLVEKLRSRSSDEVRNAAKVTLSQIGPLAVPELIQAVGNQEDNNLQSLAAETLGRIGEEAASAVSALTQALSSDQIHVRRGAAEALGQIGPAAEPVVPALLQALDDKNLAVRGSAAKSLARIGPAVDVAAPAVLQLLADGSEEVRRDTIKALAEMGPASVPLLIELLEARDIHHILRGRLKEFEQNFKNYMRWLQHYNSDKGQQLSRDAIVNFDWHRRELLEEFTPEFTATVHEAAVRVLREIGPPAHTAIPTLMKTLTYQDSGIRQTAAQALGQIGPQAIAAIPSLIKALLDSNGPVREAAGEALHEINPEWSSTSEADNGSEFLAEELKKGQPAAGPVLERIGSRAVPELIALLRDKDRIVRQTAAEILGRIGKGAQPAIPALHEASQKDSNRLVREAAERALERMAVL